jgi:formylglycine-generating enzyme required for sulfatase activity
MNGKLTVNNIPSGKIIVTVIILLMVECIFCLICVALIGAGLFAIIKFDIRFVRSRITDDFGVSMRLVPAGDFLMGSDLYAAPIQKVYLDDYYIDVYEVTNKLYRACVEAEACQLPGWISRYNDPNFANHPVVYVDWWSAKGYCEWRGARLPTEAEWEKAASWDDKSQTKYVYPWGNQIDCSYANINPETYCKEDTTPVGSYPLGRSSYGLFDMAGNVEEWTSSLYLPYPYDANDGRENPYVLGPRVLRGGSYYSYYDTVRSDYRSFFRDENLGYDSIGFRCAHAANP